jgi:hypothetical protein
MKADVSPLSPPEIPLATTSPARTGEVREANQPVVGAVVFFLLCVLCELALWTE